MSEETVQATGTAGKVLQWITIIGIGLGTLGPYLYPEKFASEVEEATIEKDVKALKEEVKVELRAEYDEKIRQSQSAHGVMRTRLKSLEQQAKGYDVIFEGIQKQTTYNTTALSITNDAVYELMHDRDHICPIKYKETNKGDNWKLFSDYYDSRQLYSIDTRSDCRAFYTPIFRTKIQVDQ